MKSWLGFGTKEAPKEKDAFDSLLEGFQVEIAEEIAAEEAVKQEKIEYLAQTKERLDPNTKTVSEIAIRKAAIKAGKKHGFDISQATAREDQTIAIAKKEVKVINSVNAAIDARSTAFGVIDALKNEGLHNDEKKQANFRNLEQDTRDKFLKSLKEEKIETKDELQARILADAKKLDAKDRKGVTSKIENMELVEAREKAQATSPLKGVMGELSARVLRPAVLRKTEQFEKEEDPRKNMLEDLRKRTSKQEVVGEATAKLVQEKASASNVISK